VHGPYESYLEEKHGVDIEMAECGISGNSGQSAASGPSDASDLNNITQAKSLH